MFLAGMRVLYNADVGVLPDSPVVASFEEDWIEKISNPARVVGKIIGEIFFVVILAGIEQRLYAVFFFENGDKGF